MIAFDILILLAIVFMVFFKLRSLLGTRPDNETEISKESAAKIFDILVKESQKQQQKQNPGIIKGGEISAVDIKNMNPVEQTLHQIPDFNKDKFLDNAKSAFEIIVVAFSSGDVKALEPLLSKPLFKKFKEIIDERKAEGVIAETDFIAFSDAQILDAKISKSNLAKIVVKFVSEQVNILKNKKNEVIEGDENFIQSITDVWTFERNISSNSPVWLLASTKK